MPHRINTFTRRLPSINLKNISLFRTKMNRQTSMDPITLSIINNRRRSYQSMIDTISQRMRTPLFRHYVPSSIENPRITLSIQINKLLQPINPSINRSLLMINTRIIFRTNPISRIITFRPNRVQPRSMMLTINLSSK